MPIGSEAYSDTYAISDRRAPRNPLHTDRSPVRFTSKKQYMKIMYEVDLITLRVFSTGL